MVNIYECLVEELGAKKVLSPTDARERATSYWDASPMNVAALVRPSNTDDVSKALALCNAYGVAVVTHGGLSGCVEGAKPAEQKVVISLESMNNIDHLDLVGRTATVEAGCILETFQNTVKEHGLYFPLDLGARGSCQLGGNAATNAGGINVIRYGMMRNLILGMEVVLADGTVLSSMNQMLKNNAGYDLKQLFIGSEGTLGIITRLVLRLETAPRTCNTALIALNNFGQVVDLLNHFKVSMADSLSAYEVMWGEHYRAVTEEGWNKSPIDRSHPFYVVAECEGVDPENDKNRFLKTLEHAFEQELILDAALSKSEAERQEIWETRENFEALLQTGPVFLYDVSLPIKNMEDYITQVLNDVQKQWQKGQCYVLGHIGDGNLHLFIKPEEPGDGLHDMADNIVYQPLSQFNGSVSAEHGIGTEKKKWLGHSRSNAEIEMMKLLKSTLDPKNILNPGVIFN